MGYLKYSVQLLLLITLLAEESVMVFNFNDLH